MTVEGLAVGFVLMIGGYLIGLRRGAAQERKRVQKIYDYWRTRSLRDR